MKDTFVMSITNCIAEKACQIIHVAAILWNFVLEHDGLDKDLSAVDDDTDDNTVAMVPSAPGTLVEDGVARRRRVLADFLAASALL